MNEFSQEQTTRQVFSSSETPAPLSKTEETAIPKLNFDGLLQESGDMPNAKLPFVWKVYEMLEGAEKSGDDHIISWVENGRAFKVHNLDAFLQKVIPKYFNQTKYKSFQRQLNFYGFKRANSGPSHGAFFHPQFIKGEKTLCLSIRPTSSKNKKKAKATPTENELKHKDGRWISAIGNLASRNIDQAVFPPPPQQQQQQQHHVQQQPVFLPPHQQHQRQAQQQPIANPVATVNHPLQQPQWQEQLIVPHPDPIASEINQQNDDSANNSDEPEDGDEVSIFGGKSFHFVA